MPRLLNCILSVLDSIIRSKLSTFFARRIKMLITPRELPKIFPDQSQRKPSSAGFRLLLQASQEPNLRQPHLLSLKRIELIQSPYSAAQQRYGMKIDKTIVSISWLMTKRDGCVWHWPAPRGSCCDLTLKKLIAPEVLMFQYPVGTTVGSLPLTVNQTLI